MTRLIYVIAILASALLSFWINGHESVVNTDAICYLISAQVMNTAGIAAGIHVCGQANWPFYSFLIADLAKLTTLSYETTAFILDGVFSAFSVAFFIAIIQRLGGTRRVLWLAAATILLSHEFNNVRQYIVRDHGYFAFYLASFYALLRYANSQRLITALLFGVSIVAATLFRVEGAIFLFLLPFLIFLNADLTFRARTIAFLKLNIITLLCGVAVALTLLLHPSTTANKLGRLPEIANQLQHGWSVVITQWEAMKAGLSQYVLNRDSAHDAGLVLILTVVSWYLTMVISNVSWVYGFLVVYAWVKRIPTFSENNRLVVWGYLAVNVLITVIFLLERLFLSNRYLVGLSLVLMIWVPFALDKWCQRRLSTILIAILIFITAIGGIIDFGYSKAYIHQAGDWLAANVPSNQRLYANDLQVLYYSHHEGTAIFSRMPLDINQLNNNQWQQYDYIALRGDKNNEEKTADIVKSMQLQPIQVFMNKRGDNVSIYKIPKGG